MKKLILGALIGIPFLLLAQEPVFKSLDAIGGTGFDEVYAVTTDPSGNVLTTGYFSNTVDFDSSAVTDERVSAGSYDGFIKKMSPEGDLLWVKTFGSTGGDTGRQLITDAEGNVYIVGFFALTVNFDAPTNTAVTSKGSDDIFILKLDADGELIWLKTIGGSGRDNAQQIVIDNTGDLLITGAYTGTVDFDPGVGQNNLTATSDNARYTLKLDTDGEFVWAKAIGGWSLTVDDNDNVYVTGYHSGTVDFDPNEGVHEVTATGTFAAFVLKLDDEGVFQWVNSFESANSSSAYCIAYDGNGYVVSTGSFAGKVDFNFGSEQDVLVSTSATSDEYVHKMDTSGVFSWVKQVGSSNSVSGAAITTHAQEIYVTGPFSGTADLNPGTEEDSYTALGASDLFIQNFDKDGNLNWVKVIASTGNLSTRSLAVSSEKKVYSSGYFRASTDFDPGTDVYEVLHSGSASGYVLQLAPMVEVGIVSFDSNTTSIYPNPTSGMVYFEAYASYQVTSLEGVVVASGEASSVDLSALQSGVYFLSLDGKSVQLIKE